MVLQTVSDGVLLRSCGRVWRPSSAAGKRRTCSHVRLRWTARSKWANTAGSHMARANRKLRLVSQRFCLARNRPRWILQLLSPQCHLDPKRHWTETCQEITHKSHRGSSSDLFGRLIRCWFKFLPGSRICCRCGFLGSGAYSCFFIPRPPAARCWECLTELVWCRFVLLCVRADLGLL